MENLEKLRQITEQYCHDYKKCPDLGQLLVNNYLKLEDLYLEGHSIHDFRFEGTKSYAILVKLESFPAKDQDKTVSVSCNNKNFVSRLLDHLPMGFIIWHLNILLIATCVVYWSVQNERWFGSKIYTEVIL